MSTSPRTIEGQRVASLPFLGVSRRERGTQARHPRACRIGTCVPDMRACPPARARSSGVWGHGWSGLGAQRDVSRCGSFDQEFPRANSVHGSGDEELRVLT